jgi:ribosomal protein S18 acetylase RimI-like enzyme
VKVSLRPLDEEEVRTVAREIERGCAEQIEQYGHLEGQAARRKAAQDIPQVLADPKNDIYALEEDGRRVGHLWIGERELQERRVLWIWDVFVDPGYRGRGLGREALRLAEDEARRRGLDRVELNVFGGNEVARRLYSSLDYEEIGVVMGKQVA